MLSKVKRYVIKNDLFIYLAAMPNISYMPAKTGIKEWSRACTKVITDQDTSRIGAVILNFFCLLYSVLLPRYNRGENNMKMLKDSKAVSPVIGVMLMLVVTVILAAAVSSTSSGLMKTTDKTPTAIFDVKVVRDGIDSMGYTTSSIMIKEVTGDAIDTKNIKIITTNYNATGTQIREILPGVLKDYSRGNTTDVFEGTVPYWNNVAHGYFGTPSTASPYSYANDEIGNPAADFGSYTLKPGVQMTAQGGRAYDTGVWNTNGTYSGTISQMQDMFADWGNVSSGDFVNVKIVDLKSSKVIFASDVEVM